MIPKLDIRTLLESDADDDAKHEKNDHENNEDDDDVTSLRVERELVDDNGDEEEKAHQRKRIWTHARCDSLALARDSEGEALMIL